jgi:hypothetical protein
MNSFAEVARANASAFGGGDRDLRVTMAYSYSGAPAGTITGRLADDVDAHSLDDIGRVAAGPETDNLMIHAFGMGFAPANDLDPNRAPSARNNNRGSLYEHALVSPTPKVLAAAGLGSGYARTSTDTTVLNLCPYLAVFLTKLALDLGEIDRVSTLLKRFWIGAGLPWNPSWDTSGGETTTTPPTEDPRIALWRGALTDVKAHAGDAVHKVDQAFPHDGGGTWAQALRSLGKSVLDTVAKAGL